MKRQWFRLLLISCFALAGSACTSTLLPRQGDVPPIPNQIPPLTMVDDAVGLSGYWRPISFPLKRRTDYHAVKYKGKNAIKATAKSSASGIEAKLDVDVSKKPIIAFSWYTDSLIDGADNTEKNTEDSPLRIILSFDGDKDTLIAKERRFHDRAKLLTGRELPYATLMYIWENQKPINEVIINPHTTTIKKIVITSGKKDLKKWIAFRRNVYDDYVLAFGKPPGKLTGIALMSDTDNTGTNITAYYSDVILLEN
jgi:Protein of unknown function (DUF3047)